MIALDDLLEAASGLDARLIGRPYARHFDAIAYDSRTIRPGELFVAVRTDRADGHDFVGEACSRGAAGVLVERGAEVLQAGTTCVAVSDTRAALAAWARLVLGRQAPDVIAVAGGVGKTSTEEALVRSLTPIDGDDENIFKNGNLNDLFGLPVALGGLQPTHVLAVLELASDHPGEMADLVAMARPRTAVVTNVAVVHRRTLGNIEQAGSELLTLIRSIPGDGWTVLNADDPRTRAMIPHSAAPVLLYGRDSGADLRVIELNAGPEGLDLELCYQAERGRIRTGLRGLHNAYTILAAAAVSLTRGIPLAEIAARLEDFEPLPGRLRPLAGRDGTTVLDDSHSAGPRSLAAALETLALESGRHVAVLGEIEDLDADDDEAIAAQLAGSVDLLVTLGAHAEALGREAQNWGLAGGNTFAVSTAADVQAALSTHVHPGDTILVKGSESARMERVVETLMEQPDRASALLVRQDPGWKQRVFLPHERPTWIELDLGALASNVARAKDLAGPSAELMIVLKADAYGHGAIPVARTAFLHGASIAGVACLSEALALREAGIRSPILLLGHTPGWQARDIVANGLTATVYAIEAARQLSVAALASRSGPVAVHVKIDTGMSRLGVLPQDSLGFFAELAQMDGIRVEGVFTHLATADGGPDDDFAQLQLGRFRDVLRALRAAGHAFRYIHAANSAGLINGLDRDLNLVRVGILAYGLNPSARTSCPPGFRPVLSFKTRIAQVKELPEGSCVSYGCSFVTQRPSSIAVIPVGYGDGFRRSPHDWGEVLVRGRRAPIAGAVCMDMTMIDVTDIAGVKAGDEVVLIGSQGTEHISVDDVAARLETINYEVVTQILPRVPRTVP